jgi:polyisoprenoid-binding protein YceI
MKKTIFTKLLALFAFVTFGLSAHNHDGDKKINTSKSSIHWIGKKVTGQHDGTINFTSGKLTFKNGDIVGGEFIVDMTSINATDLEGEYQQKLNGHLKADDFFGVDKHPTSKLVFTKVEKLQTGTYQVTADLTIKGHTESVSFTLKGNDHQAQTSVKVDRTKFGIRYGSGSFFDNLGDKTIDDEFTLEVSLSL